MARNARLQCPEAATQSCNQLQFEPVNWTCLDLFSRALDRQVNRQVDRPAARFAFGLIVYFLQHCPKNKQRGYAKG